MSDMESYDVALDVVQGLIHELTYDIDNKSEIELKPTDKGYIITRYTSGMGSGYRVHQLYGLSESEMLFIARDYLEIMMDRCHARSREVDDYNC